MTTDRKKLTVKDIKKVLDDYIVGQDQAKLELAKSFFLHMYQYRLEVNSFTPISRRDYITPHILLTGPTGCGKTEMVSVLSEQFEWPMITVDMSSVTPAGYVGTTFAEVLADEMAELSDNRDYSDDKKERVIIFLDEFDKIIVSGEDHKDVREFKSSIQYELLKFLELGRARFDSHKFGTKNIHLDRALIVFAGNFPHLRKEKIVKSIGFGQDLSHDETAKEDMAARMKKSNISTQLQGRITFVGHLDRLTEKQLHTIVNSKKVFGAGLDRFYKALNIDGASSETINKIVKQTHNESTGARGLKRGLVAELLSLVADSDIGITMRDIVDDINALSNKQHEKWDARNKLEKKEFDLEMRRDALQDTLITLKNNTVELKEAAGAMNDINKNLEQIRAKIRLLTTEIDKLDLTIKELRLKNNDVEILE